MKGTSVIAFLVVSCSEEVFLPASFIYGAEITKNAITDPGGAECEFCSSIHHT